MAETENAIERHLSKVEARLEAKMNKQVKTLVLNQLRDPGFDPDLTAGALTTLQTTQASRISVQGSYATAASKDRTCPDIQDRRRTKEEKQEEKFWECRRSLWLWPVQDGSITNLRKYLTDRLEMEEDLNLKLK